MSKSENKFPSFGVILGIAFVVVILIVIIFKASPANPPPAEVPVNPIITTYTFTPSVTPTFTLTPTETSTPSITPTATLGPSTPYIMFDDFDVDTGKLKITNDSAQCTKTLENGVKKIECFSSASEDSELTLFPADPNAVLVSGVEMAFYTLPLPNGTEAWGKYQLHIRYGSGSSCNTFERGYVISIRVNELGFVETDGGSDAIGTTPKELIGTLQPHVIRIEVQNNVMKYYLDNKSIRDVPLIENTSPLCWEFQSQDTGDTPPKGYRGIGIMWIAIKP